MKRYLSLILLLAGLGLSAQERTYSFTIEEAVDFAIDSSYTTINSRRDIARALKQKWETTATGLPQIDGAVDYQNQLKQPVTPLPAEIVGGEPGTFVPVVFGVKQQMSLTATLRQLIFDGSYLVALEAASTFLDYSQNFNEKTMLEVRKGVINAYGGVLVAQENVSILERNLNTLADNLEETRITYENGFAEEEDVEQLQVTYLQVENELNNGKRYLSIARQMFNLALGIPVEAEVIFEDDLNSLAIDNVSLQLIDTTLDFENNVDYKIAKNLNEQRALELKLEKSRALPTLSGFVNYGTQAFDNDFIFFDTETRWYQSSILGVSMNIPIFSSLQRSARTQQAKIAYEQAKTSFRETVQQIELELNTARSDYRYAIENYQISKQNLDLAERIEKKNQIKFREGIASSFELRQAQTQLYTAQREYIESMFELIKGKAELETILNTPDFRNTQLD